LQRLLEAKEVVKVGRGIRDHLHRLSEDCFPELESARSVVDLQDITEPYNMTGSLKTFTAQFLARRLMTRSGNTLSSEITNGVAPGSIVRVPESVSEMSQCVTKSGFSWGEQLHHMNGQEYSVYGARDVDTLIVYDETSDMLGYQDGMIYLPLDCVEVVQTEFENANAWVSLNLHQTLRDVFPDSESWAPPTMWDRSTWVPTIEESSRRLPAGRRSPSRALSPSSQHLTQKPAKSGPRERARNDLRRRGVAISRSGTPTTTWAESLSRVASGEKTQVMDQVSISNT